MGKALFWRRTHRVLALIVGLQALLWMASGLYMTAISIDVIHGDHLAHRHRPALADATALHAPAAVGISRDEPLRLKQWRGHAVYEVGKGADARLVDARSGQVLSPLSAATARAVARDLYQGEGTVESVAWLTRAPAEVGGRPAPMWRVRFADGVATTLYISPFTGERLATRHTLWRAFDVMWMLHIMDYRTREDIGNPLLRIASVLGLLLTLAGLLLSIRVLRGSAR
ncbi:MAG: hypothetical protein ACOY37_14070 [Pseudomonadota bacterium]